MSCCIVNSVLKVSRQMVGQQLPTSILFLFWLNNSIVVVLPSSSCSTLKHMHLVPTRWYCTVYAPCEHHRAGKSRARERERKKQATAILCTHHTMEKEKGLLSVYSPQEVEAGNDRRQDEQHCSSIKHTLGTLGTVVCTVMNAK